MADIEIKARISADASDATKGVNDFSKSLDNAGKVGNKTDDNFGKLKDTLSSTGKESKSASGIFGSLGTAVKALGVVSLITSAFEFLKETFMKNQKVADAVGAVFTTISTVINKLIDIVISVTDSVSKSSNGFEGLKAVMMGLLTIALTPIKVNFFAIKLVIQEAQLAWENSFFGDKNKQKTEELNKGIAETKQALADTAKEALNAADSVATNLGKAATEVTSVVSGVVKEASKISIGAIYEQSKATIQLKNNAALAEERLKGLVEEYDRQAEKLRQIRDDDSKSITERIAANNKLGDVLKEQQKTMLALADTKIAAAASELQSNTSSIELQKALIAAQNERKGVLATVAGFESEQLVNRNSLMKEYDAMLKATGESESKINYERLKANADSIKDELHKTEVLKQINESEAIDELSRLNDLINNTKLGTQARVDAEIAYNEKKNELDIQANQLSNQIDDIKKKRLADIKNAEIENSLSIFNAKKAALELEKLDTFTKTQRVIELAKQEAAAQIEAINAKRDAEIAAAEAAGLDTTGIKQKYATQADIINIGIAKSEKDLAKAKIDATTQAADAAASSLNAISQLLGEATGAGKALAIASTTISTFSAAQKAYESTVGIPFIGPVLAPINAALAVASGIAQVKKILAVQVPNGGGGSVPSAASLPTPITPQQQSTMLNSASIQGVGNAAGAGVGRSFVLDTDIKDNQERQARINRAARLG